HPVDDPASSGAAAEDRASAAAARRRVRPTVPRHLHVRPGPRGRAVGRQGEGEEVTRLLYRLFGAGRMPAAVRGEIAGERVLFEAEGIRVALHRSGRVPGSRVIGGVNVGLGAFAVTERRVAGSRGRAKWVDVPFDVAGDGPATLTLDGSG